MKKAGHSQLARFFFVRRPPAAQASAPSSRSRASVAAALT